MAESFFASLQCELLDRGVFKSKPQARMALFTYIEGWYNEASCCPISLCG
jgi:putative transposase